MENLPNSIIPMGFSNTHRNLELMHIKGSNIIGFQGHPEELKNSALFDLLIKETINKNVENW